jgi:uncharacterized membrane protein
MNLSVGRVILISLAGFLLLVLGVLATALQTSTGPTASPDPSR